MPHSIAARAFASWLEERRYAPSTVRVYSVYVERLLGVLTGAGIEPADATLDDLYEFWCTLPASAPSRNQARKAFVTLFKSLGRDRGEPADALPSLPESYGIPRPVETDDFARLIAAARDLGGIHHVVGFMLAYTGCRISEMRLARWSQFELRSGAPVWYISGKGSGRRGPKERQVPLHPQLVTALTAWRVARESSTVLFPSSASASGFLSDTKMRSLVYEIAEQAGIDKVVPHRYRHTVATVTLAASHDIRGVQELLGHGNLATTQRYTKVVAGRLVDIVGTLPP